MTTPPPPPRFSRIQVLEMASGAVLAAAIITTSGGMSWLLTQLPNKLNALERDSRQILTNQSRLENRLDTLWGEVRAQDRRLIRLELR